MPELPEVETLCKQLEKAIVGKKISQVKVLRAKSFKGKVKNIIGQKIIRVERKAKILLIKLTQNYLLIHLKLTGQLIYQKKNPRQKLKHLVGQGRTVGGHPTLDWVKQLPSKHTRVIITFSDQSILFFNDLRVFGWIKVVDEKRLKNEVKKLGIEPFDKEFTIAYLKSIFSRSGRAIKLVLMDQKKIAGIGNIYSNDALFGAGIDPRRPARSLEEKEIKKLRNWILKVLKAGIKYGGASENTYRQLSGLGGKYQKHFLVYQRDGEKCRKCNTLIKRIKLAGRGTFYCPQCQR